MPADPEDVKQATNWLTGVFGAGALGILKLIFGYSKAEYRLDTLEKAVAVHDERLDESDQNIKVLLDRGDRAISDRREMLDDLKWIKDRIR